MPFAVIVGWWGEEHRAACGLAPVDEPRVALVGARDLDPGEASMLAASQIVSADGIAQAIASLPADGADRHTVDFGRHHSTRPWRLASTARCRSSWDAARLRGEMSTVAATGRLVALSLCCGNPRRDVDGQSTRAYLAGTGAPRSDDARRGPGARGDSASPRGGVDSRVGELQRRGALAGAQLVARAPGNACLRDRRGRPRRESRGHAVRALARLEHPRPRTPARDGRPRAARGLNDTGKLGYTGPCPPSGPPPLPLPAVRAERPARARPRR